MIIKMRHVRKNGCSNGARGFALRHGFDWSDFLKKGIPEEKLLATGDAMAVRIVGEAHGK